MPECSHETKPNAFIWKRKRWSMPKNRVVTGVVLAFGRFADVVVVCLFYGIVDGEMAGLTLGRVCGSDRLCLIS